MDETSATPKENPTPISDTEENPITMAATSETPKENPTETLKESPPTTVETPKETPTDIAEILKKTVVIGESSGTTGIPTENPPATIEGSSRENHVGSFSFGMKPARMMKLAIEALAESEFNPQGLARIDVDATGFEITVYNPDTHVTGFLLLDAPALIDFKCSKSVRDKTINLAIFSDKLKAVDDEDTIAIDLLDGSTVMAVKFGSQPSERFTVELLETTAHCRRMSNTHLYCEAALLPKDLRKMIEECHQAENQPPEVIVDLTEQFAAYSIRGTSKSWLHYSNERLNFINLTRGISDGKRYNGDFVFCHGNSLRKASLLLPDFIVMVSILRVPPKHILLCFPLIELGDMAYVMEAIRMPFMTQPIETDPDSVLDTPTVTFATVDLDGS